MDFENRIENGTENSLETNADNESESINDSVDKAIVNENTEISDEKKKVEIVGVKFKKSGKTYHFSPNGMTFKADDRVIVDTSRGHEYAFVSLTNREISLSEIVAPLREVLRFATDDETKQHEENVKKEVEAYNACIALIDRHKLEMKLIDAEMSFDRSKLLFYFSSEGRVDFRELVKDLALEFHTRIEMRQIGIRDEAKILGGLGICGRPFCCSSFLQDFVQVSVKMAKEQNLSLNAAKISGSCGRLMCCLRYEYDTYLKEKSLTPKVDTRVMTPDGPGIITDANPLAGIVKVRLDSAPDDASQVVFVREDVIKESEYNGEILVKTAVPDRSRKNDIENEFMPVRTIEASDVHATAPEAPKEVQTAVEKTEKTEKTEKNEHQGQNRKFDKRRHVQGRFENEEQSIDDKKNRQNEKKPSNPQQSPKNQEDAPKVTASNEENLLAEQPHFKKKHKPYYRNFKKNKNGGDKKSHQ